MPGWNIHLEAGNRLANKLKFSAPKRKEFLLGCLLPDINNGYINKVKIRKHHHETHYAYNQKSSLNFYAENRSKILEKDPMFLGYLFHLYTDGYFNYDFYRTIKRHKLGQDKTHDEKSHIKHNDFYLYDACFHHTLGLKPEDLIWLAREANEVKSVEITPSEIQEIEDILIENRFADAIKGKKYLFYTKKRLDNLLEDMIESFQNDYIRRNHA